MRIGYCRVSSAEQNTARQEVLMERLGVDKIFIDKCSGKNTDRPALKEMLDFIRADDIVIVESISRLCRNVRDLLEIIDKFQQLSVTLDATHKVPRHPGLPQEEHRSFPATLPRSLFYPPDLDSRVDSLLCLEGVPDLPVAPQDEAGLTTTFQTWPRGWFHIP